MRTGIVGILAAFCMSAGTPVLAEAEKLRAAIWVDPDGCEHWVIDDGAEGYMSPHLRKDGTPVCRASTICGVLDADILFAFDSAVVTPEGRARVTAALDTSTAHSITISGHTDHKGSDAYNMNLSRQRASAVAEIARDQGAVVADIKAHGERSPRASNATDEGRRQNRRVEIQCHN